MICKHPDCGKVLAPRNITGFCKPHSNAAYVRNRRDDIVPGFAEACREGLSIRQLVKKFGVSGSVAARWRNQIGVEPRLYKAWGDDDAFLRANYGTMPTADIAKHLDRTVQSIKSRVKRLGLIKARPVAAPTFVRRELMSPIGAGLSGEARYFQSFGEIVRCHSDGTLAKIGACYRYAGRVWTQAEIDEYGPVHRDRQATLAAMRMAA